METALRPGSMGSLPRSVLLMLALHVQSASSRDQCCEPSMAPFFHVTTFGSLLYWKGHHFFLIRIDTYSENGFAFPAGRVSASITIQELPEYMICRPGIPHKVVYYQEIYFRVKDVCRWTHEHRILWYHALHRPKAATMLECQNVLLQAQMKYKFRGNTPQVWGTILQDIVYALNLSPPCQ